MCWKNALVLQSNDIRRDTVGRRVGQGIAPEISTDLHYPGTYFFDINSSRRLRPCALLRFIVGFRSAATNVRDLCLSTSITRCFVSIDTFGCAERSTDLI